MSGNAPAAVVSEQTIDEVHVEDELIVGSLISTGGPTSCVGEPAGVPSADDGLNLWGPDENEATVMVPDIPASGEVKSCIAEFPIRLMSPFRFDNRAAVPVI